MNNESHSHQKDQENEPNNAVLYEGFMKVKLPGNLFIKSLYSILKTDGILFYKNKEMTKAISQLRIDVMTKISISEQEANSNIIVSNHPHQQNVTLFNDDRNETLNWILKLRSILYSDELLSMDDFNIISVIGRGYYGKVMLCRFKSTGQLYAIKTVHKSRLVSSNKIYTIIRERNCLVKARHPFIVSLFYAFQTSSKFYLVLEYAPGGELYSMLDDDKYDDLTKSQKKLYLAEIGLALGYLHSIGIIYRDLKPENILLDQNGHIKLTDFGLSKEIVDIEHTKTFCGTPQYVAPEIVARQNYAFSCDWWSYGILAYELLYGDVPFYSENKAEQFEMIQHQNPDFPETATADEIDFIQKLLVKDPKQRSTFDQLRNHKFWYNLDLDAVYKKEIKPEFVPEISDWSKPTDCFDESYTNEEPIDSIGTPHYEMISGFSYTASSEPEISANSLLKTDSLMNEAKENETH